MTPLSSALYAAPLHWSISGLAISMVVMLLLIIDKKSFGISSSLKHLCAIGHQRSKGFFGYDLKPHTWSLIFTLGIAIGGGISTYTSAESNIRLGSKTIQHLTDIGLQQTNGLYPQELYKITNPKGVLILILGGLLIGFGTRYAQGCTSGHSIFGIANLHFSSLAATIFFFVGGLTMTYLIIPYLF